MTDTPITRTGYRYRLEGSAKEWLSLYVARVRLQPVSDGKAEAERDRQLRSRSARVPAGRRGSDMWEHRGEQLGRERGQR